MPSDNSVYFKRNSTGRKMADKQILCIMNLPLFSFKVTFDAKVDNPNPKYKQSIDISSLTYLVSSYVYLRYFSIIPPFRILSNRYFNQPCSLLSHTYTV